jgi:hypothetical protein
METEDASTQSREQLHAPRNQILRLHQQGYQFMKILELAGLSN